MAQNDGKGNVGDENHVDPVILSLWVSRLIAQGKLPKNCMTWRTSSGERIAEAIKKAVTKPNLFDSNAPKATTMSIFEPVPGYIPNPSLSPLSELLEQVQQENLRKVAVSGSTTVNQSTMEPCRSLDQVSWNRISGRPIRRCHPTSRPCQFSLVILSIQLLLRMPGLEMVKDGAPTLRCHRPAMGRTTPQGFGPPR